MRKARGGEKIKKYGYLAFGDVLFYRYLLQIGLTPAKSLTLGPLKVSERYFADFLRGVIDGDGNIHRWSHPQNGNEQWELRIYSAAPHFVEWLYKQIQENFKVKGVIILRSSKGRKKLQVIKFGKMAAREILTQCYYQEALSLDRKRVLAQQCINSYLGWTKSPTVRS